MKHSIVDPGHVTTLGICLALCASLATGVQATPQTEKQTCLANQKTLIDALLLQIDDYNGVFPNADRIWTDLSVPSATLVCPAHAQAANGYGYNRWLSGVKIDALGAPSETIVFADTTAANNLLSTYEDVAPRHEGLAIYAYADGHVEAGPRHLPIVTTQDLLAPLPLGPLASDPNWNDPLTATTGWKVVRERTGAVEYTIEEATLPTGNRALHCISSDGRWAYAYLRLPNLPADSVAAWSMTGYLKYVAQDSLWIGYQMVSTNENQGWIGGFTRGDNVERYWDDDALADVFFFTNHPIMPDLLITEQTRQDDATRSAFLNQWVPFKMLVVDGIAYAEVGDGQYLVKEPAWGHPTSWSNAYGAKWNQPHYLLFQYLSHQHADCYVGNLRFGAFSQGAYLGQ